MKKYLIIFTLLFTTNAYSMDLKGFCFALQNQDYEYLAKNTKLTLIMKSRKNDSEKYYWGKDIQKQITYAVKGKMDDDNSLTHLEYIKQKNCSLMDSNNLNQFSFGLFHLIKEGNTYKIDYIYEL